MSWKAEVVADRTDTWSSNGLRFATPEEAEDYVSDLACRWTAVRKTRAVKCDDPVTHKWVDGKAIALEDK